MDRLLAEHKDAILKQVRNNIGNYRILEKYKWIADYHNFKFNELFDHEDWIDSYFSKLENKLVIPMTHFPSFFKDNLFFLEKQKT
jgi:hypothetical protein